MAESAEISAVERRRHERHSCFIKAELNGQPVTVLDISLGGIGGTLELRGKLEVVPAPGEAAMVELLPEDGEPILLTVEVKRVGEDLNLFGAQIVEMSAEQFEAIERLCADWAEEEH